jgi:hypothetical protein
VYQWEHLQEDDARAFSLLQVGHIEVCDCLLEARASAFWNDVTWEEALKEVGAHMDRVNRESAIVAPHIW